MCSRFADIIHSSRPARCAIFLLISASVLFADPSVVFGQVKVGCKLEPQFERDWSDDEKWAWQQICKGEVADFNERPGNQELNPRDPAHDDLWAKGERTLSWRFLKDILLRERFRNTILERGVRIRGAYFEDKIKLWSTWIKKPLSIKWPLSLEKSFFKSHVRIDRLTTTKWVSFAGSKFQGRLDMDSAKIDGDLFLSNAQFNRNVSLKGVEILGQFDMHDSEFRGEIDMNPASNRVKTKMRDTKIIGKLDEVPAFIREKLDMRNSVFRDKVFFEFSQNQW